MPVVPIRFFSTIKTTLVISLLLLISACSNKNNTGDLTVRNKLELADSLYFSHNSDSAQIVLKNIRPHITASDPLISTYYCQIANYFTHNSAQKSIYTDSAIAFFSHEDRVKQYPDIYYTALLAKGDACLAAGKYITAINYYYQAKRVLAYAKCDNGELDSKMGQIYYGQQNFALSGKYWGESFNKVGLCDTKSNSAKIFYLKQGALNNAGFAYQKADMPDSANYYYQKDLAYINKTAEDSLIQSAYLTSSRAILYDNLGGFYLMTGNELKAKDYLDKCIKLYQNTTKDGSLIPPYIKLARLYMETGDKVKADSAFEHSKFLLDRFAKDNPESLLAWNKSYAEYLLKKNDIAGAYHYQDNYTRLKDSIDKGKEELYRLDIVRELNAMQQKQVLTRFRENESLRKVYYIGGVIIFVLFSIILVLINRNLKKTKRNHRIVTQQNEQLQETLSELERVNKNYIRIMRVMAHDLRNPISGMTGLAAMLHEDDAFTDESKHMLKLIETTGIHSMEMINELLKTGLADENELLEKQNIDLTSLLYDSIELLQFKANDKQQQIIFDSDNTPVIAEVNHEKMWRVVNNLIINAIKFSHTSSVIKVGITHDEQHILISVADNGIGIPESQKETVFEMFTSAKKVGTDGEQPFGLGLSISKKIVEMHKGRIWFESNCGSGTIFFVQLPYSVPAA
jgi:signal transduction histidine kinase